MFQLKMHLIIFQFLSFIPNSDSRALSRILPFCSFLRKTFFFLAATKKWRKGHRSVGGRITSRPWFSSWAIDCLKPPRIGSCRKSASWVAPSTTSANWKRKIAKPPKKTVWCAPALLCFLTDVRASQVMLIRCNDQCSIFSSSPTFHFCSSIQTRCWKCCVKRWRRWRSRCCITAI